MDEFPSNSQFEPKPPERVVEQVTTSGVSQRKKPLGARFKETFFSGADSKSVVQYVVTDIIVPAVKDLFVDASTQAVERLIFGESRGGRRSGYRYTNSQSAQTRTRYDAYSGNTPTYRPATQSPSPGRREITQDARAQHDFSDIVLDSRADAERVSDMMYEILRQYGEVTVSDLYQLVGITPKPPDNSWGWKALTGTRVTSIRGGQFVLDLPNTIPLN